MLYGYCLVHGCSVGAYVVMSDGTYLAPDFKIQGMTPALPPPPAGPRRLRPRCTPTCSAAMSVVASASAGGGSARLPWRWAPARRCGRTRRVGMQGRVGGALTCDAVGWTCGGFRGWGRAGTEG